MVNMLAFLQFTWTIFTIITVSFTHPTDTNEYSATSCNVIALSVINNSRLISAPCQNITLLPFEFTLINGNSTLTTIFSNLKFTDFNFPIENDENVTVSVCYPFSNSFFTCVKWKLHVKEVELRGNTVWSEKQNSSYDPGNYRINPNDQMISVCVPDNLLPFYYVDLLTVSAAVLSLISLSVTICILYCLRTRGIHDGRPIMCHVISLYIFYLCYAVYHLVPIPKGVFCRVFTIIGPYSLRSAFCWLNVVMFEMWRRFRKENFLQRFHRKATLKTFLFQATYGWGVSALIIASGQLFPVQPVSPISVSDRCNLGVLTTQIKMIFSGITTGIILLISVIAASLTIINLRRLGSETLRANPYAPRQLLCVYIKLLVMTGIIWILGLTEWAVTPFIIIPSPYWIIIDVLYALQGFFLFCIYSCSSYARQQFRRNFFGTGITRTEKTTC